MLLLVKSENKTYENSALASLDKSLADVFFFFFKVYP